MIGPVMGALRQGPPRCPPRADTASPSKLSTKTSQAGTIYPLRVETRLGATAWTTRSTMKWQKWPSGHAGLEQRLGEADCASVVCWQKSPGCTGIHRRHCRFLPGSATRASGSVLVRSKRTTGGSKRHPASMALSDESYREESNRCKEAEGAQDDLFNEEDDDEDINRDKDNYRDNKASNAKLVAIATEEQTQQQSNVGQDVASGVVIGQTPVCLGRCRQRNKGKDASAMLTVMPADASNDASAVLTRMPAQHQEGFQLCDNNMLQHHN